MANVQGGRINGNIVYWDRQATGLQRYLDAFGPDVVKVAPNFANLVVASDAMAGWTTTLVEAGGGESTVTAPDGVGGVLLLTTDAGENDGITLQKTGEVFELTADQRLVYFRLKCQISDAMQSDFFVGLGITDTTPLGGISDGVYFQKDDGAATFKATTEKDSTETNTAAVGIVVAATDLTLEIVFVPGLAKFYVNGALVATHTTNIPDDEALTPTIQFLTGEAVAKTMAISDLFALQVGR